MNCDWDDDDLPPQLSTLPDQVHAVKLSSSIIGTAALKGGELRPASTTDARTGAAVVPQPAATEFAAAAAARPFKRGFLDPKPHRSSGSSSSKQGGSSKQRGMPLVTGKVPPGDSKQIPEFLRLEPTSEQQQLQAVKSQLLGALQPTPETVAEVGKDATLMAGFDDPEVMAAVADIAGDPSAIKKYAKNPKVFKFYKAMGSLVGSKLEKLGTQQQPQAQAQAQQQSSSRSIRTREYLP